MKLDQNKIRKYRSRFTNTLDLAGWLEETDTGIVRYLNLVLLKCESNVIILDENEEILTGIEIAGQHYYATAEIIDNIAMRYRH